VAFIGDITGIVEDVENGGANSYTLGGPDNPSIVEALAVDSSLDLYAIGQSLSTEATDVEAVNPDGSVTVLASGYSPTSLAVDQYSTSTITAAPEPSTLLLIGGGLAAFGLLRQRRRV
jgi:hypothetical protein